MQSKTKMLLFIVSFVVLLLSVSIKFLLYDFMFDIEITLTTIWAFIDVVLIYLCTCLYRCAYFYTFDASGIRYGWGAITLNKISFEDIDIVFVRPAVNSGYGVSGTPINCKNKKQRGVVSFYLTDFDFTTSYEPTLICFMNDVRTKKFHRNRNEALNVFLDDCDLKILLEKTDAKIYIAYSIYGLYKYEFDSSLSGYESRVYLILPKRDEQYNNIPYNRIYQNE